MEKIVVERDNERSISFTGELIAHVKSSPDRAMGSSWSGETGRWQTLKLWRTKSGKFVCQRINHTQWQGERDTFEASVCFKPSEVCDFFGYDWLAQELFEEANINCAEEVE